MPYIPWGDHRGGRLELAMLDCSAPHSNPSADPPQPGENCLLISAADFHLPVHKLPEFTGTLHEAAGKPVPVILDRPQTPGDRTIFTGGYSVDRDPGAVTIYVGREERRLTPDEAREYAAAIAARADEAAASRPDPAQAAALTAVAREALQGRWDPGETAAGVPERVARMILARYTLTERTP